MNLLGIVVLGIVAIFCALIIIFPEKKVLTLASTAIVLLINTFMLFGFLWFGQRQAMNMSFETLKPPLSEELQLGISSMASVSSENMFILFGSLVFLSVSFLIARK